MTIYNISQIKTATINEKICQNILYKLQEELEENYPKKEVLIHIHVIFSMLAVHLISKTAQACGINESLMLDTFLNSVKTGLEIKSSNKEVH